MADEPIAPAPVAPAAPAPVEAVAPAPAPAADAPVDLKVNEPAPAAAPAADAKPAREFAPSLLDEVAKPAADAPKPDGDVSKDAAKPADGDKPPETKEPAAKDAAKPDDAAKADAAKAADPAKPAEPPAPIEYKFTYPEGVKPEDVDTERMGAFTRVLNETRVPAEAGQKLLDLHLEEVGRVSEQLEQRQWDVFAARNQEWREKVMADPELGGARHDTAIRTVMGLIDAYSLRDQGQKTARSADAIAAERKELLDIGRMTGAFNHPTVLRLLHWAGQKLVREGSPKPATPPRGQSASPQQRGLRRYAGTTPANGAA